MARTTAAANKSMEMEPGTRYAGRFTIENLVHTGPLGNLYRARSAEGTVALRVFNPELTGVPGLTEYLRTVAREISETSHPGLVTLFRFGVSAAQMYTAHQFATGGSLADRLAAGNGLKVRSALQIIADLAPPLSALHAHNILHGNVEPTNIVFDADDNPCLTDARLPGVIERAVRTLNLPIQLDIPLYIAPEVTAGREADPRSDQYSLAAVLYHLLAGKPPFPAGDAAALAESQFTQTAPNLRKINPEVDDKVARAVEQALAFARDQRFDTLAEFLVALDATPSVPLVVPARREPEPTTPAPEPKVTPAPVSDAPRPLTLPLVDLDRNFGRFEVHALIGQTELNLVYRATDRAARREVALKLLADEFAALPKFEKYFLNVVKRFSVLQHDHLVPLLRAGTIEGRLFYSLGLMSGSTLAERLRDGPLPIEEALAVVQDIGTVLNYLHQQNLVHLNLKPTNVFFDDSGEAHVSEVGLAPMLATAAATFTAPSQRGVFAYMSPEQLAGRSRDRKLDVRSDVYSLGALLFHMLTGQTPYKAGSAADLALIQFSQPVPSARALQPAVGLEVDEALRVALSFNRAGRFESVAAFMSAVTGVVPAQLPASDVIGAAAEATSANTLELLEKLAPELAGGDATATVSQENIDRLLAARQKEAAAAAAAPAAPATAARPAPIARPVEVARPGFPRWLYAGAGVVALVIVGAVGLFATSGRGNVDPTPAAVVVAETATTAETEVVVSPTDDPQPDPTDAPVPTTAPTFTPAGSPTPLPPTALPTNDPLSLSNGSGTIVSGEAVEGVLAGAPSGDAVAGSALVDPGTVSQEVRIVSEQLVQLINQQRGINGLPPLVVDEPLTSAALTRTADMVTRRYFSHTDPATGAALAFPVAASVGFDEGTYVGENLGRTTLELLVAGPTLVDAWMESPTHRANILRPEFDFIGVGMAYDDVGRQWIVTTLFASKFAFAQPSG